MQKRIKLSSLGFSVLLKTWDNSIIDYFIADPLPKNHVPEYKCELVNENGKDYEHCVFEFDHRKVNNGASYLKFTDGTRVELGSRDNVPPGQLVFALLPVFERLYEFRGMYGFHSASVVLNDSVIFVVGDTKSGKSTISAKLHYDHEARFISDERSVIDIERGTIVSGTKVLSLREYSLKTGYIKSDLNIHRYGDSISTSKEYFVPKEELDFPIRIKKALFVFPHFSDMGVFVENISDFVLSYLLYENVTATIRSCISMFVADSVPLPSMDTNGLAKRRAVGLKKFLSCIPHRAIDITGRLEEITSQILMEVGS